MKTPRRWPKQTLIEEGFIAALLLICISLTLLQYHWTSQVSVATTDRVRNGFTEQVRQLGRAFDDELTNDCNALLPGGEPLNDGNREAVHVARLRRWLAGPHRPIFQRMTVVVPRGRTLAFFLLDPAAMKLVPAEWPGGWESLRANLQRRAASGGGQPFSDPCGVLREFPVFGPGGRGGDGNGESEWMIFELDLAYARNTWLPELTRAYLHPEGEALSDLAVRTRTQPPDTIYETTPKPPRFGEEAVTAGIDGHLQVGEAPGPNHEEDDWTLTAWQHPDALDRAVRAARWRNLALAVVLNVLMLAGGVAIIRYTRRSRQLAEAQMRFVANVSHELRTPLTVIRGAGHNLGRGIVKEPAQVAQYGQMIRQHADQLTAMIEQVLELAGARRQEAGPAPQPVALAGVLEEAIRVTIAETAAAHCRVQADLLPDLPPVHGDALALRRVFQNLITNAAKHAAIGGWIGVSAEYLNGDRPPTVQVRIADNGPGIPEAEQPRIFDPFFRGSGAQERQIRGSGLGLSLVREIVEAHHGKVFVRSDGRRGATFTVQLPVAAVGKPAVRSSSN